MLYPSLKTVGTDLVSGACDPLTWPVPTASLDGYSVTDLPSSQYCVYPILKSKIIVFIEIKVVKYNKEVPPMQ